MADENQVGPRMSGLRASNKGFNPVTVNAIIYLGTAVLYFVAANLRMLPILPYPAIGCLLPATAQESSISFAFIIMAGWGVHYVRRLTEVLFVHDYRRKMPYIETVGGSIYYWVFAFWIGWSTNPELGYRAPHVASFVIGCILFVLGEIGNCVCHVMLKNLRQHSEQNRRVNSTSSHILPRGFLFELVACPHYFCEIVTWLGFGLMTFTLSSWLFFAASLTTLVIYSRQKHDAYIRTFDGKEGRDFYPTNRKALIPYIF